MRSKTFLIVLAALSTFFSCAKEEEESTVIDNGAEWEFTAVWGDDDGADSRTALQGDGTSVWWMPKDEVNLFYGIQSGKFTSTNSEEAKSTTFKGSFTEISVGQEINSSEFWAVYPYGASNTYDGQSVTLSVSSTQTVTGHKFTGKCFPAVAHSTTYALAFYNVCGGVRFSVTQSGITSIVFKSNDGSPMAGKVQVGFGTDNKPIIQKVLEPVDFVKVVAPDGGFTPGKYYYAAMIPASHADGMTLEFLWYQESRIKTISNNITVRRSVFGILEGQDKGLIPSVTELGKTFVPVDLGLPSGLKWASFNLGATKPEEYGSYYAWGETEPKSNYSWSTYTWCMNGSSSQLTKYCYDSSYGYNGFTDNKTVLAPEDDAAAVALGGSWRMATYAEWNELKTKCTWTWTTQNGVKGRLVTGPNGNSIFLPAAGRRDDTSLNHVGSHGRYWSSSLYTSPYVAYYVCFNSDYVDWYDHYRYRGLSVRPVYPVPVSGISLNKSSITLNRGESESLTATIYPSEATNRNVQWSSSDTSIATVDDNGLVIAVSVGTAVITATTVDGGFTASCTIEVKYAIPEMVDLGLPSGLKWASFNLGATKPEEYGDYFAWGETEPKWNYDWSTYKWCKGSHTIMTKYCHNSSYGYNGFTDNKTILDPEDDAAAVALGGSWRMATRDEWNELKTKCRWTWTTQNGVNGRLITGPNGNSIFLPAAGSRIGTNLYDVGSEGYYWSSSLGTDYPYYAYYVYFYSDHVGWRSDRRYIGLSVRPVYPVPVSGISLNKSSITLNCGKSESLTATIYPSEATYRNVNWSSSDTSIATVDDNGLVYAVSVGTAVITATTVFGGFTAECTVKVEPYKAQTPDMVDLGLPSGLKWASFNLGATKPEEYGDYFAWGETKPKSNYSQFTYKWWMNGSSSQLTKYCTNSDYGYNGFTDNKTALDPEDDAAAVALGGSWRMATYSEWDELETKCTWTWTTQNGVKGRLVTGPNGNSIFLPAAGYRDSAGLYYAGSSGNYWSSSLNAGSPYYAYYVYFYSSDVYGNYYNRSLGQSVRPVYSVPVSGISLNKSSITLNRGKSESLTATIYPSEAYNRKVQWSSSDTNVATVDADGLVIAVSVGTAVIKVTTVDGGFTAECTVTVEYKVQTPAMIDLGLSVKWASFNLGATKPEEYGAYFAWGEIEPKSQYNWSTYKWCMNGSSSQLTKYCSNSSYGYSGFTDNKIVLDPEDDAAAVALGGSWRMATYAEWDELETKCTWTWTTQNGVNGRLVTGPNGNSIFLPAAGSRNGTSLINAGAHGYYCSSFLYTDLPGKAYNMYFFSSNVYWINNYRFIGRSVRPVYDSVPVSGISLNKSSITLNRGKSESLIATIYPSGSANFNVNWSSSDTSIATVDDNGLVYAVSVGTAVITATTVFGGFTAECMVKVEPYKAQTPEMVDLGLSVKWASFNLGATAPEEYGIYFAWGETEPKSQYNWSTYKWCMNGSSSQLTKYCSNSSYGYSGFTDNKIVLDPEDDAAAVALGGSWRMATYSEWDELKTKCTWTWTTQNGVNGRLVTGPNGNSIFLPAAGYRYDTYLNSSYGGYWSSFLRTDSPGLAYSVRFNSNSVNWYHVYYRYYGLSVRPVYDSVPVSGISLNKSSITLNLGASESLTATIYPSGSANFNVNWSSSDTSIATVDANGNVIAVSVGTAVITATTVFGGFTAECTVKVEPYKAQTPDMVDLGLPSGLKWASFNLGATKPEEYGIYYAWGETEPKSQYNWSTYKWCMNGSSSQLTKYCNDSSYGYNGFTDNKTVLEPEDDAAAVALGGSWRMATYAEWEELKTKCTWTRTTQNGVNGRLVTGPNGNSIFLPAAGYRDGTHLDGVGSVGGYWSSSLYTDRPYGAYYVYFNSGNVGWNSNNRYYGRSVRPVTE